MNPPIKQEAFGNFNISSLEDHSRVKSSLISPASNLPFTNLMSWRDQGLNEVLWAVIIRGNIDQGPCLKLFRKMVFNAHENLPDKKNTFITHSALATLSNDQFDVLFQPIFENVEIKNLLRGLLIFQCLPDRHHWKRNLQNPEKDIHLNYLFSGVSTCLDHQSQESTDIRWFKVLYMMIVCERFSFAEHLREKAEEICQYPEYGDQTKVCPSIRAMEMSLRGVPGGEKKVPIEIPTTLRNRFLGLWHEDFWKESFELTPCFVGKPKILGSEESRLYSSKLMDIYNAVSEHFASTLKNTDVNAKHDAAFGILLYTVTLGIGACKEEINNQVEGRFILRTVAELYITLKYLAKNDNSKIWEQFRNYGTGQSKLAFLKNLREDELPSFININDLYNYANEDFWSEFLDINIKSWAEKNLRKMAEEVGVKKLYDQYYDWSSGYAHGHWGAIRDSVFTVCLNPLHRYHRVPFTPRFDMPSVLPDIFKILNLQLDTLNELYPPFENRINA